jgi:hypothetical protein
MANHRELKLTPNGVILGTTAALAAMALYNVFRARRVERAHPPSGRFVNVNGVRLHYLERGAGPQWCSCMEIWSRLKTSI